MQLAVEPCPGPNVSDPSSKALQHITDLEHPDGKIATWGVETIGNFTRAKIGMGGANKPFFLGVVQKRLSGPAFIIVFHSFKPFLGRFWGN